MRRPFPRITPLFPIPTILFVGADLDCLTSSVVPLAGLKLAIVTLVLDPSLALRVTTLASSNLGDAALVVGSILGANEIPLTINEENTRGVICQPSYKPRGI